MSSLVPDCHVVSSPDCQVLPRMKNSPVIMVKFLGPGAECTFFNSSHTVSHVGLHSQRMLRRRLDSNADVLTHAHDMVVSRSQIFFQESG